MSFADVKDDIEKVRGIHQGGTFLVVGSGPSAINVDALRQPSWLTMGSNSVGRLFSPDYYAMYDPTSYRHFRDVFDASGSIRILSPWIEGEADLRIGYEDEDEVGFSLERVFHGRTSGFINMSLACIMGGVEVHLLGIDGYDRRPGRSYFWDVPPEYEARSLTKWSLDRERLVHDAYVAAGAACRELGIHIINWSTGPFLRDIADIEHREID